MEQTAGVELTSYGEYQSLVHKHIFRISIALTPFTAHIQMPCSPVTGAATSQRTTLARALTSKCSIQPMKHSQESATHTSTLMAMRKFRTATLMATTNHHLSCRMTVPMVPSQRPMTKWSFLTGLKLMARSWSIGFRLITQSVQLSLLKLIQALLYTLAAATK